MNPIGTALLAGTAAVAVGAHLTGTVAAQASRLSERDLPRIRGEVLPTEQELAFYRIGWHAELRSALVAAHRAGKPVLLWAMNGHPLGCT